MSEPVAEPPIEEDASVTPAKVPSVGEQLRAAREKKNWQILDIAQTLKLGTRQVEALENGEWSQLPGHTFIRGFVRNYARLVNLDPAVLMTQLEGLLEKPANSLALPESKPANMTSVSPGSGRRDRIVALSGVALALLAVLIYLLLPGDLGQWRDSAQAWVDSLSRNEPPPAPPAPEPALPPGATVQQVINPQAETAPETTTAATTEAGKPADPVAGVTSTAKANLRFVIEKDSWVEVRDRSDNVVFSQRILAGNEQQVEGSGPFSVVLGYAPGVKIYWRGQAVDLQAHTRGDVARLLLE